MDQNVGEWLCMIWRSCKAFTHAVSENIGYLLARKDSQRWSLENDKAEGRGDCSCKKKMALDWSRASQRITYIPKVALRGTPEGKRKKRRSKSTWRRTAEAELRTLNVNWKQASRLAKDWEELWGRIVDAVWHLAAEGRWWIGVNLFLSRSFLQLERSWAPLKVSSLKYVLYILKRPLNAMLS